MGAQRDGRRSASPELIEQRAAAIVHVQAMMRGRRARSKFGTAKAAVDRAGTGVLLNRADHRQYQENLRGKKAILERELEEIERYQYYQRSSSQREIRLRSKQLRHAIQGLATELDFLERRSSRIENNSIARRASAHEQHYTNDLEADSAYQQHNPDQATDFWLAMASAQSAVHHDWQALEAIGVDHEYDPKAAVISLELSTRPFGDGGGGGGGGGMADPAGGGSGTTADIAAFAVPYRISLSREGSRAGSSRGASRPHSQQGLRGGLPPMPTSSGSFAPAAAERGRAAPAVAAAATGHVYVRINLAPTLALTGTEAPLFPNEASFRAKAPSSAASKRVAYIRAVHSGDEIMRKQLVMCMLLCAGRYDVSNITMATIRKQKEELKTIEMQRRVAQTALEYLGRDGASAQADETKREALVHYLGMIDYVISMHRYMRRLSWFGLLKRGVKATIPGYGYRPYQRNAVATIQRYWRGYRLRAHFDLIDSVHRQDVELRMRLRKSAIANARYQKSLSLAVATTNLRAMDTQTACAVMIQRQMRYVWCEREHREETRKQQLAADQIQQTWRKHKLQARMREQTARLGGKEQAYVAALKEHRRAVRQQKRLLKQRRAEMAGDGPRAPMLPLLPPAAPPTAQTDGSRSGLADGGSRRLADTGTVRTFGLTTTVAGSTARGGGLGSLSAGSRSLREPLMPPPPPPPPDALTLPGSGHQLHEKLVGAAISRLPDGPSRRGLMELRGYAKPPPPLRRVLECVCMLLNEERRPDWAFAQLQLADPSFLIERLRGYASAAPPSAGILEAAARCVASEGFSPESIERAAGASPAAKWLCAWCRAVVEASQDAAHRSTLWLPKAAAAKVGIQRPSPAASPRKLPPLAASAPAAGGASAASAAAACVPEWGGSDEAPAREDEAAAPHALLSASSPGDGAMSARQLRPQPPAGPRPPWHTARPALGATASGSAGGRPRRKPRSTRHLHTLKPFLELASAGFKSVRDGEGGGGGGEGGGGEGVTDWRSATLTAATKARVAASGAWVQTQQALDAAGEEQAAALRAMLETLSADGGSASGAIALARRAAEPPPPATAEREEVSVRKVFRLKRAALLGGVNDGRSRVGAIASLWADGGFLAAHRKRDRAALKGWRERRQAWNRASGLRRQLVLAIAEREEYREARTFELESAREQRAFLWKIEDDAALHIQDWWRERRQRRAAQLKVKVTEQLALAQHSAVLSGAERAKLVKKSRIAAARRRKVIARQSMSPERRQAHEAAQAAHEQRERERERREQARKEEERLQWTRDLDLQQVSAKVEAGLEPLLDGLRARMADLDIEEQPAAMHLMAELA